MTEESTIEPALCDRCGGDALGLIGEEHLCENCVHEVSACCGEIGLVRPIGLIKSTSASWFFPAPVAG